MGPRLRGDDSGWVRAKETWASWVPAFAGTNGVWGNSV
jgi:hypothetical protein